MKKTTDITAIWEHFHKELKAFIQNKIRNSSDSDDILQDAFIRVIRNWDQVNQSKNIRLYLYGIVRNSIYDYFKNKNKVFDTTDLKEVLTNEEAENLNATVADCCIKPFINKLP